METQHLATPYQQFIHVSRYARWIESEGRRETWIETVDRYVNYITESIYVHNNYTTDYNTRVTLRDAILNAEIMPSMRGLMTAGPALERDSTCIYNCSYLPVDSLKSFYEAMYILMCGTGVGYSVEKSYVDQLPTVPGQFTHSDDVFVIGDSKAGWANVLKHTLESLYSGVIPKWDSSLVREAGAPLKTFGGRASGPEPLNSLLDFVVKTVTNAAGRKLTCLEAHFIMCKIAEVVVVGGVRRSAMICLSDLNDEEIASAKTGEFWQEHPELALANISAVYDGRPDRETFDKEWNNLVASGTGERGLFNREASQKIAARNGRRDASYDFGTNPCSEIILRPRGFCNLTEVVIRDTDTLDDLKRKVEQATILGTFQATFTRFPYLSEEWTKNAQEEALLGVSLTGEMGHRVMSGQAGLDVLGRWLEELKQVAIDTNAKWAARLGINPAAAITCVKPSGTVSQLVNVASGIHTWFAKWYYRTVRGDNKDPLSQFMKDLGIYSEADLMKPNDTTVFYFPIAAPKDAITRNDLSAIEHLNVWLTYQRSWCEHKPSITINVRPEEWAEVGEWVWEHFDEATGISFLPHSEHIYMQAPYQELTEEQYIEALNRMPESIDWTLLKYYEQIDSTTGAQDLACVAGQCEVVDFSPRNLQENSDNVVLAG